MSSELQVGSKAVSAEIRRVIWPALRESGFTKFSRTTAWRSTDDRIDVLNFQMMGAHLASRLETTTYSFAINLAIYFPCVPSLFVNKSIDQGRPPEYHGHFRESVKAPSAFSSFHNDGVWALAQDLSDVEVAVKEALLLIQAKALPWFDEFGSLEVAYRATEQEEVANTLCCGTSQSPSASLIRIGIASQLGWPLDTKDIDRVLSFEVYEPLHERLRTLTQQ